ncbi:MAG: hypothetical protein JSV37_02965, partial [Anaerolineaceae bacterium]
MEGVDRYWNPILETMPQEKLRALQLVKFKRVVQWAYDHSRFHHQLYTNAGIKPGDIRTLGDSVKVPKVEKGMMQDIQCKDPFP